MSSLTGMEKEKKSPAEVKFREKIEEDIRPWGKFRSYPWEQARSIKIITVSPGSALSLQYHHKRSEFWVVLDSGLEITLGEKTWNPEKGEEIFILKKIPHRLRCIGSKPARVMEIWIGQSEEEDIVRLSDEYGRIP